MFNKCVQSVSVKSDPEVPKMKKAIIITFALMCKTICIRSEEAQKIADNYFIYTKGCQMRSWPITNPQIRSVYTDYKFSTCRKSPDIIQSFYNATTERYHLKYLNKEYDCKYCPIERKDNSDREIRPLSCTPFSNNFVVPLSVNGILVKCTKFSKTATEAFAFVQKRNFKKKTSRRMPSILILGIDSMSRINFRRTMPNSYKYLTSKGFVELLGYNKVEEHTFPNLMAIHTGKDFLQVRNYCDMKNLSSCGFIWDAFKALGYITAYAEDNQPKSTFTFNKRSFTKEPTDFYFKAVGLAMETYMDSFKLQREQLCIGNNYYADHIYNYGYDFATHFNNSPTFGLFWTNSFSHGCYDTAYLYDDRFVNQLNNFEQAGIFENSIVFVHSDHGFRHGEILKMEGGFSEVRLPFFFVRLPQWFKDTYPTFNEALIINSKRLVSNFDIYKTFKHIVHLYNPNISISEPASCKKCHSIFYPFYEDRTCSDAGIVTSRCTCDTYFPFDKNREIIQEMAKSIVLAINQYVFMNSQETSVCSQLSLYKVISAKKKFERTRPTSYTFDIELMVAQYNATFQAVVEFNPKIKKIFGNVEEITRLDSYKRTANCIDDKMLKLYCICKNSYLYTGEINND